MKIKIFTLDNQIKIPFFIGIGSILLTLLFLLIYWQKLPPQVPLFYSKPWGEEQLVSPIYLSLPSGISVTFLVVNTFFASLLPENIFLKRILVIGAVLASILSAITIIHIVLLIS